MAKEKLVAKTMNWRAYLSPDRKAVRLARYDMKRGLRVTVADVRELLSVVANANANLTGRLDSTLDENLLLKGERLLTPWEVLNIAHARLGVRPAYSMNINEASRTIMLLMVASEMLEDYRWERARAERLIGEIWHQQDERRLALKHFQQADSIDPTVGVKRRIKKLQIGLARFPEV